MQTQMTPFSARLVTCSTLGPGIGLSASRRKDPSYHHGETFRFVHNFIMERPTSGSSAPRCCTHTCKLSCRHDNILRLSACADANTTRPPQRCGSRSAADEGSKEPVTLLSDHGEDVFLSYQRSESLHETAGYVPAPAGRNVLVTVGYANNYPSPEDLAILYS